MQLFLLVLWCVVCAERDARHRRIPNSLTLGALAVFLIFLLASGRTWLGGPAAEGLWASLLALGFTLPGYVLGRLGGADVKFLVALALATNSVDLLATFIGAGIATLAWLSIRRKVWPLMPQGLTDRYAALATQTRVKQPFVPFLLIGFCFAQILIR